MAKWMNGAVSPQWLAEHSQWLAWGETAMEAEARARAELEEQRRAFGK